MTVGQSTSTASTDGWPVTWDGDSFEYKPIPESWLRHPDAYARAARAGPQLLAVSVATYGPRTLRVRYAHPRTGKVLVGQTGGEQHNGGVVPSGLKYRTGWPRSLRPGPSEPVDELRPVEVEHMQAVWSDVLKDVPEFWTVPTDGGEP